MIQQFNLEEALELVKQLTQAALEAEIESYLSSKIAIENASKKWTTPTEVPLGYQYGITL